MVSSRKRGRQEMEAAEPPKEVTLIERIRNMWEFANLAQWIFIFGRAVKIDENLDIEELEMECLKTCSTALPEIGLALLKFVSSHRGLTLDIFEEYTRRQYIAKASHRNPFGEDDEPTKFNDLDVFTKIRVLQQLTQWTMGNPDRIREKMEEHKDAEQTIWRIEPFGWDSEDRTYFVLDDNRLYRRTDPPLPSAPAAKPKKNSKKAKAARRASKRRRISEAIESDVEPAEEVGDDKTILEEGNFGGMEWECIAITLDEFTAMIARIEKSRDPNEKVLRKRIIDDILPLLERQEEARKRKAVQKERELLNLEKLATAKRSSRIAGRLEQQKQEEETRELERKKQVELGMARKEQEKWLKLEKERESRMMTREQRLQEREARRILHEEELANLSEDSKKLKAGESRVSERHLKAEIEKNKQALEELAEEDDWIFDCICGAYGQIDDGTHSIACERCSIWQHSKCVEVSHAQADREDFHFICTTCQRRAKDEERAKNQPPIKIKIKRPGSSSSPIPPKQDGTTDKVNMSPVSRHLGLQPSAQDHSPQKDTPGTSFSPLKHPKLPPLVSWQTSSPAFSQHINQETHTHLNHPSPSKKLAQDITLNALSHSPVKPFVTSGGESSGPEQAESRLCHNSDRYPLSAQTTSRMSSSHGVPSSDFQSRTDLTPLGRPQTHAIVNGNHGYVSPKTQLPQSTLSSDNGSFPSRASQAEGSPSPPAGQGHGVMNSYETKGYRPDSSHIGGRRGSFTQPSPLVGAPILTPSSKPNSIAAFHASSSPLAVYTPVMQPHKTSPAESISARAPQSIPQTTQDPSKALALPPAVTGLSPTKQSPPRPITSNGSFGSATPSMIPPVTSLSPSPQLQNLTPPVKQS